MKDPPKNAKMALQSWAKLIAMHVRNEMEDFHCEHLSDAQMKELNPIIRNAIYAALRQLFFLKRGNKQQRLVAIQNINHLFFLLPEYWEEPDLAKEQRHEEDELADMDVVKNVALVGSDRSRQEFLTFLKKHLGVFD